MKILIIFLLTCGSIISHVWCCKSVGPDLDWWQTAQFYQIYPRSFKDSDGDGIGDLNGITEKLDYLKDIGITATWLSPIFKSPMADFGYDIADFFSIQPEYGTMSDFENMLKKAKQLGIRIILDLVPNHSSDENDWFYASVNKTEGYEDFYIWHPGFQDPENSTNRIPPCNWLAAFRGSAWEWNEKRQEFYYHKFAVKQPDLNYRNPKVVEKMNGVIRFWLDKGVDGFRVDAVPTLFESLPDENTNRCLDEPFSGLTNDTQDSAYLKHIYTEDLPETTEMVYQWREVLDEYKRTHGGETRLFLAETYSAINIIMQYYGNGTRNGVEIPFNFNFITKANQSSNANDYVSVIKIWMDNLPAGRVANWVVGNHDQRRAASRYGEQKIDTINMMVLMLPGVSVTYNGEEIGMTDVEISWENSRDPAACNSNPDIYQKFTRDPERTPFQWDDTKNAGFSNGSTTWLPVSNNYRLVNVKVQNQTTKSHLNVYKDLVELRKRETLRRGELKYKAITTNVLVIAREYPGYNTYVLVANFGPNQEVIDLTSVTSLPNQLEYRIISVSSKHLKGDTVAPSKVTVEPYESFVLGSS